MSKTNYVFIIFIIIWCVIGILKLQAGQPEAPIETVGRYQITTDSAACRIYRIDTITGKIMIYELQAFGSGWKSSPIN